MLDELHEVKITSLRLLVPKPCRRPYLTGAGYSFVRGSHFWRWLSLAGFGPRLRRISLLLLSCFCSGYSFFVLLDHFHCISEELDWVPVVMFVSHILELQKVFKVVFPSVPRRPSIYHPLNFVRLPFICISLFLDDFRIAWPRSVEGVLLLRCRAELSHRNHGVNFPSRR